MNMKKIGASVAALTLGTAILFTGCGSKIDTKATLINIDNGADSIELGYANFLARYQQSVYDQYYMPYFGEDMWTQDLYGMGTTMEDDIKAQVLDSLKDEYALAKHYDEYGVALSVEEQTAIEAAADSFMASNSEETLEALGANRDYVVKMLTKETMVSKAMTAIKNSKEVTVSDEECWQKTFSYAFFSTTTAYDADGNSIEVTDDYIKSQKAAADKVAAADDFDAAAEESGATVSTYSFTKGTTEDSAFGMDVINAAEKLAAGEVSSVIEVADAGYYVLRLDSEHDAEASQTKRETMTAQQQSEYYNELLTGWQEAITWEVDSELWSTVKFDTLFKSIPTDETQETENN
ncbi:MAG: peptidyl-prolyl cis-trans isomerase [Pseudobutyrivibrio sp.]|nr:peptidyl-prolyl cis-trans isomerase [Pseudobutyrivibrio sp.]